MAMKDASLVFPAQSTVACEGCRTDVDVIWFCKNCSASLCTACKEKHSREKFLRGHQVVERSRRVLISHGAWKIAEPCQKHQDKEISTFCIDCSVPCCITCMEERHQRHGFTSIEKKYLDAEKRLNEFVNILEKITIPTMESDISNLSKTIVSCNNDYEVVRQDVNKFRYDLKHAVDQSCDRAICELDQKHTEYCDLLQSSISNIERERHNVENLVKAVETRIRNGGLDVIGFYPNMPSSNVLTTSENSYPRPNFVPNKEIIGIICAKIGTFLYDKEECNVGDEEEEEEIPTVNKTTFKCFQADVYGDCIQPTGNEAAWVSWFCSNTMYLHDTTGTTVRSVIVPGTKGINDIVIKDIGDIIVTCDDKKVRQISDTGKVTILIDAKTFRTYGVCLTENEEIVVCMSGQGDKNHVTIYTPDGKRKIREIMAKYDKVPSSKPYRVLINGKRITILNVDTNVITIDKGGKLVWSYDGSQAKLCDVFEPSGMSKDKNDNFFITDSKNHCIHCINNDGGLLTIVPTSEFNMKCPWGIGVSRITGKMWLGSTAVKAITVVEYDENWGSRKSGAW